MAQPLVSVIIPTFNRATWIGGAIRSVLEQDYTRLELIVVDDGSSDQTSDVVEAFGTGLTYICHVHTGVSAARNRGVAASHGELVAFLDSDNLWLPGKVAAQVALFQKQPQAQACYTDEIWIRHGVRVNPKHIHQKHDGWIFFPSLPRCIISPSSIMLRRTLWDRLGGFDERLLACEDYDLWLRLSLTVLVSSLQQRLIVKRGGHADQLSRSVPVLDQYRITALEKLLRTPLTAPQRQAVLKHLRQKCAIVTQGACKLSPYSTVGVLSCQSTAVSPPDGLGATGDGKRIMSTTVTPTFQHVPLADIALDDDTCLVTYQLQMEDLQRSVVRVGVLTPLHLRRLSEQTRLQVVCGASGRCKPSPARRG